MSKYWIPERSDFRENFPFQSMRDKQIHVLNEICDAYDSGYNYIILEAPTGFGKSPVAVAVALTLGSSYICTSTKDLQTQYSRDFPFIRMAKGKNNFSCLVKEDFIRNENYKCGTCTQNECYYTSVDFGPCISDKSFKEYGCNYKTSEKTYTVINKGTKDEQIFLDDDARRGYQNEYSQWVHLKNLKDQKDWRPCYYYDQLNIAKVSSHSIFNYSMFLTHLPIKDALKPRDLLVLDEGHLLEQEIVKFASIALSKR